VPAKVAQLVLQDMLFQEYFRRNQEECEDNLEKIGIALTGKHL
jgi:hypothetical protein